MRERSAKYCRVAAVDFFDCRVGSGSLVEIVCVSRFLNVDALVSATYVSQYASIQIVLPRIEALINHIQSPSET